MSSLRRSFLAAATLAAGIGLGLAPATAQKIIKLSHRLLLSIGMEPVHAGIMIVLALNISLMTPPVGACLFVLASVTGERIEAIARSLWPFLVADAGGERRCGEERSA